MQLARARGIGAHKRIVELDGPSVLQHVGLFQVLGQQVK